MSLFAEGFGQQPELKRSSEQLRHVPHIQPSHQIEAMHFHGAHADLQHVRNLAICMAYGDQPQDVSLPGSQQIQIDGLLDQRIGFSS